MKKILLMAFIATLALTNTQAEETSTDICKTYIKEAHIFQSTNKKSEATDATLDFYKDKIVSHCGNITSKETYNRDLFAQSIMKKEVNSAENCKLAINMAKSYDQSANKSSFMTDAHKVNIADNCGTLVAKKAPAFCLFSAVDNSKEEMKGRCIASIDKAHTLPKGQVLDSHKNEVIANCGRLQSNI